MNIAPQHSQLTPVKHMHEILTSAQEVLDQKLLRGEH